MQQIDDKRCTGAFCWGAHALKLLSRCTGLWRWFETLKSSTIVPSDFAQSKFQWESFVDYKWNHIPEKLCIGSKLEIPNFCKLPARIWCTKTRKQTKNVRNPWSRRLQRWFSTIMGACAIQFNFIYYFFFFIATKRSSLSFHFLAFLSVCEITRP